jgi:hypothetical protein
VETDGTITLPFLDELAALSKAFPERMDRLPEPVIEGALRLPR